MANRQQGTADPERQQDVQIAKRGKHECKDHIGADPCSGAEEHQHIRQAGPQKMVQQDEQVVVHVLEKYDGENQRSEGELMEGEADPEADKADKPVNCRLDAPVEMQRPGRLIELLRDRVAAQGAEQAQAGNHWKDHRSAGNEAVDSQRLEVDEPGDKECKGELCSEREPAQPHDRQRCQGAATQRRV